MAIIQPEFLSMIGVGKHKKREARDMHNLQKFLGTTDSHL
jgi:hypothetical protein